MRRRLSIALIVLGCLLAPVSVVAVWASADLADTDSFTAVAEPLIEEPAFQDFLADRTSAAVLRQLNLDALASSAVSGLGPALGPQATAVLDALKAAAVARITGVVKDSISTLVGSESFQPVWRATVRASHAQFVATMTRDPNAVVTVGAGGIIGVQIGPIVEAARAALADRGIAIAENLPTVDRTIVLAAPAQIEPARVVWAILTVGGAWFPVATVVLLGVGVALARRRVVAVAGASGAAAVLLAALLAAVFVAQGAVVIALSSELTTASAAKVIYAALSAGLSERAALWATLAGLVAVVAGISAAVLARGERAVPGAESETKTEADPRIA